LFIFKAKVTKNFDLESFNAGEISDNSLAYFHTLSSIVDEGISLEEESNFTDVNVRDDYYRYPFDHYEDANYGFARSMEIGIFVNYYVFCFFYLLKNAYLLMQSQKLDING
jgi:hypothetical protein